MALKLIVNWYSKTLVGSTTRGGLFTLPSFTEGDIVPVEIYVVEPDVTGVNRYLTPDISNLSLSLSVEDSTTPFTIFVNQPTWTKDVSLGSFSALVDFNTAELNTWLGSAASKTGTLKIKRTDADGSVVTIYQTSVTVIANLSGATPSAPLVGTTALTLEAAKAMFVPKLMDPGDMITFRTQDGTVGRTIGVKKVGGVVQDVDYQYNI